ncbi:TolC family protein [Sulfurimonas sp.]|uniref:TolC family protein n=1 Tax=Sulfurimonas sp. TaxID=2022749 RepID=UPI003563AAF8
MIRIYVIVFFIITAIEGQTTSLESIIEQAIEHSYKLKIIKTKKTVYEAKEEEVSSSYYPTLSMGFNFQYTKGYEDGADDISNIGDTILSSQTQYESSVSLKANYLLYDFGARGSQLDMAELDKKSVNVEYYKEVQKLKLELLDLYSKILNIQRDIELNLEIKKNYEKIYLAKKRLNNAGKIDKVSLASEAIRIVELSTKIEENRSILEDCIYQVNLYTGSNYKKNTEFTFFSLPTQQVIGYEESIGYKEISFQKQKKAKELEQVNSEFYPSVSLFGKHNWYGAAECSANCALEDLKKRNYVVGISVNWVLFNGFQTVSKQARVKAELEELRLQELEEKREFEKVQYLNIQKILSLQNDIQNYQDNLNIQEEKLKMNQRLRDIKKIDKISEFEDRVEKLQKILQLKQSLISKWSKQKELEILNENIYKDL